MRFTAAFERTSVFFTTHHEPGAHHVSVYVYNYTREKSVCMTFDRATGKFIDGFDFHQSQNTTQ